MLDFEYNFGGYPITLDIDGFEHDDWADGEDYEYTAEYDEAEDYLLRTHDILDIIQDWINEFGDRYTQEEISDLFEYMPGGFDGTIESAKNMTDDEKLDLVSGTDNMLYQLVTESDIYDDELQDYFEQDAYDEWESNQ